ncbi:hypothetical protein ACLOJK_010170 [Asimina triloba]
MVKLDSARESRLYGPRLYRNRAEYVNAGLYVIACVLLILGFAAQLSVADMNSGLVLLLAALAMVALVNVHDLVAHMAGIDFRCSLLGLDTQLALVEFAVPLLQAVGALLFFLAILFLFLQKAKGYDFMLVKHAVNLLSAGPVLWLMGSIHNAWQVYERADGHLQFLQKGVQIPFLMGSLLFFIGAALNMHAHYRWMHHGLMLGPSQLILKTVFGSIRGESRVWFSISGSLLFFVGAMMNLAKVFKMQQMGGGRLEKLRGGAQERLMREREGQVPLILEEQRRRKQTREHPQSRSVPGPTPYKDVLIGQS